MWNNSNNTKLCYIYTLYSSQILGRAGHCLIISIWVHFHASRFGGVPRAVPGWCGRGSIDLWTCSKLTFNCCLFSKFVTGAVTWQAVQWQRHWSLGLICDYSMNIHMSLTSLPPPSFIITLCQVRSGRIDIPLYADGVHRQLENGVAPVGRT